MSAVEQVGLVASLIMSAVSFLAWIYTMGFKMGALDTKVTTLWEIYVKDALSEAARLSRGNPERVTAHELFSENLREEIRQACNDLKNRHRHDEVLTCLEKKFGDELMKVATDKKVSYRVVLGVALLFVEGTIK